MDVEEIESLPVQDVLELFSKSKPDGEIVLGTVVGHRDVPADPDDSVRLTGVPGRLRALARSAPSVSLVPRMAVPVRGKPLPVALGEPRGDDRHLVPSPAKRPRG